jgi:predicted TIM-barrel fold metal-dependent hydrolase
VIVDSHVHVGRPKYPPVEQYLAEMDEVGIAQAVLMQYIGNPDNGYLADCVRRYPGRFVAVAMIDADAPDAPDQVAALADDGGFAGLRLYAASRSPGADRFAVWRALAEHNLVASVRGPLADLAHPEFAGIVAEFPELSFRLEHMGFAVYPEVAADRSDFDRFLALAAWPNTSTMWSGFYLNAATGYPYPDAEPYLREAVAAFGPQRMMWSGDWRREPNPPAGYYIEAVQHVVDADFLDDDARAWIFSQAAAAVFPLPEAT